MRVSRRERFELRGGNLCLDFVNTVSWRLRADPIDYLGSVEDLLTWGSQTGVLAPSDGLPQANESERHATLARARALRERIHRILTAAVNGTVPAHDDLVMLNADISDAVSRLSLERDQDGHYAWAWQQGDDPERVLWAVTRATAELLVSPNLDQVKVCEGAGCGWMFLDTSRNRQRRWCDPSDCGNRERVRRHAARQRAAQRRQ
jgi:predicted RNA-binding Zn ribbon-like protein